jgi:hypothetical protein
MLLRKVRKEESPLLFMYRTVTLLRVVSVVHGRLAMPSLDGRPAYISQINRQMLFVDNIHKKNIINHLAILFINQILSK